MVQPRRCVLLPPAPESNLESPIVAGLTSVPLYVLTFLGSQEYKTHQDLFVKKFQITKLPQYLIVQIKRFTKNTFFTEKNPTVVNFPVRYVPSTYGT
jgi:hypothetical protein